MSHESDDAVIAVRRQWNDRRIATYRLRDISELQWGRTSGGTRARTPQLFVHGYVMCDAMIGGKLAHSCSHGPAPHRIKVCLTRKGNNPSGNMLWLSSDSALADHCDRVEERSPHP